MKFGVCIPNFGEHLSPESVKAVCRAAEELGYHSLWTTDHIVTPAGLLSPYRNIYESLTVLAYAAGITRKTILGSSVVVLPLRDPILAAKQFATLDALSEGRLIVGLAAGWAEGEFRVLGGSFGDRGARLDEQVELLRALWTQPVVNFVGRYYKVIDVIFEPKPCQDGGPQVWIGGNSRAAVKRAARLGDAWHATSIPLDEFRLRVEELRRLSGQRQVEVTARMAVDVRSSKSRLLRNPAGERRVVWGGGTGGVAATLSEYEAAGLEYLVVYFGDKEPSEYVSDMKVFGDDVIATYA